MEKLKIGYDDNLGLPADFAKTINCEIIPFHQLDEMITQFNAKTIVGMFAPAGTLPYLTNYKIIAQSLFGKAQRVTLQSNFVSAKKIFVEDIPNLKLGRVNQFCTTSFWSPLITLMDYLPEGTHLKFVNTNGFADMLHKTAIGELDCAMVWDIILKQNPEDAARVHQLFSKSDLPTPVLIGHNNFPTTLETAVNQFRSTDPAAFFSGFQPADVDAIKAFMAAIKKAQSYFKVEVVS